MSAITKDEAASLEIVFAQVNRNRKFHFPRKVGQLQAEVTECGVPMTAIYVYNKDSHTVDIISIYVESTMVWDDVGDKCLLDNRVVDRVERALLNQHEGLTS